MIACLHDSLSGLATLGRVTGCVYTTSACFSLLQYPLQGLTSHVFEGNPFWSSVILLALTAPVVVLTFVLQRRRNNDAKKHMQALAGDSFLGTEKTPLLVGGGTTGQSSSMAEAGDGVGAGGRSIADAVYVPGMVGAYMPPSNTPNSNDNSYGG